jgi:LPS-assembly protein
VPNAVERKFLSVCRKVSQIYEQINVKAAFLSMFLLCIAVSSVFGIELSADKPIEYNPTNSHLVATGNARLITDSIAIQADEMEYVPESKVALAHGNVILAKDNLFALSDSLNYATSSGVITAYSGSIYATPVVMDASKLHIEQRYQKIENGTLYFGQPDNFALNVSAKSFEILYLKKIRAKSVVFRIGKIPIFYLPFCIFPITEHPFWLENDCGMQKNLGFFLRNDFYSRISEGVKVGGLLDVYSKRGLLIGPAVKIERRTDSAKICSESKFGFIRDGGGKLRNRNIDRQNIKRDRFFLETKNITHFGSRLDAVMRVSWWSDPEVTRDFRPSWYKADQIPDSFAEATYRWDNYVLSAFSRVGINNFHDTTARTPDLHAEMLPKFIGKTNICNRAYVNYVHLRGKDEKKRLHDVDKIDTYYGLSIPISHDNWLNISPLASVRVTKYLVHLNSENKNYTRTVAQFGFDASVLLSGKSNYTNELWGIHGIKHTIQPTVQYRYIPQAKIDSEHIPLLETCTFDTNLPIIDLADMRNVDDITAQNMFRIGLRNTLQTSTDGYLARDLLKFDVYQDIRLRRNASVMLDSREKTLSDTYILAGVYPIHWFSLTCYARANLRDLVLNEVITSASVRDGDVWNLSFSAYSLQRDTCQYSMEFMAKLNSRIRFGMGLHYDARIRKFTEQRFSIYSVLGHSWNMECTLTLRSGAARESKQQFAIRLNLMEF